MPRLAEFVALLSLIATPAFAQDETVSLTPTQIGDIFCLSRIGNDEGPLTGILTPELAAAIADAEQKDAAWAKANPGDKPPLGDGIPWQSYQDYAAKCTAGDAALMMDEATVPISYGFPEQPDANYSDTLLLKLIPTQTGKVWRIDNIVYAVEGDLKQALTTAFMDN